MADLITGYYQLAIARDELIVEVHVPAQPANVFTSYAKFAALSADDWPSVGVAVWCRTAGGRIAEARIAVSAATERPMRVSGAEAALVGRRSHRGRVCEGRRRGGPGSRAAGGYPRQRGLQA